MIYCPNCGTANRDGSSFCNQCGTQLGGSSKTACPSCGSENPIENIFCVECGAKLAPLVTRGVEEQLGIKGLSLPTKPMAGENLPEDQELPAENAPGAEPDDIPDWLARLRSPTGGTPPDEPPESDHLLPAQPSIESDEDAGEDAPEWLAQLKPPEAEMPAEISSAVEEPRPEAQDLEVEKAAEIPAPVDEMMAAAEPALPELEVSPAPQAAAPDEPPVAELAAEAAGPPLIAGLAAPVQEEAPAEIPAEPAQTPEPEIPGAQAQAETADVPAPGAEDREGPLAAWLQQEGPVILESDEEDESQTEDIVFQPEQTPPEPLAPSDIPPWLETLAPQGAQHPEELGRAYVPAGKLSPEEAGLERAEIPAWLEALRPGRKIEEARVFEAPLEVGGLLGGMRGVLQMVKEIDPPPGLQTRPVSEPVSATAANAEMLTRLLGEPASAMEKPCVVSVAEKSARGLHWLAFLLLFAAVLLPFIVPGLVPGGDAVPASDAAAALAAQMEQLKQGDTVLLSMDYDPGASTEMDWPVQVILDDLRAKGVNLLITSVTPTGPGLAARLDTAGMQTVLLGYLPGQEMGLQRLAAGLHGVFSTDFHGNTVSAAPFGVRSLDDLALIITASSSQEPVRWWMEQVRTQVSTPIGAVISGAIEPTVRPYFASGQLSGMVSGWVGGQAYRRIAAPGEAASRQDIAAMESQSLAHLAIVLLIVLGNFAAWGKHLFGRQP